MTLTLEIRVTVACLRCCKTISYDLNSITLWGYEPPGSSCNSRVFWFKQILYSTDATIQTYWLSPYGGARWVAVRRSPIPSQLALQLLSWKTEVCESTHREGDDRGSIDAFNTVPREVSRILHQTYNCWLTSTFTVRIRGRLLYILTKRDIPPI